MEVNKLKIFFQPGDLVKLKQEGLANAPENMLVVKKETTTFKSNLEEGTSTLLGIKCMWFTRLGEVQYGRFSTKDLIKL